MRLDTSLLAVVASLALLFAAVPPTHGAMVQKMDLAQMTDNADRIFRGTVTDVEQSSVSVSGATLPAVVVSLVVEETFKGSFGGGKSADVVELKILGSIKQQPPTGGVQRISPFADLPELRVGDDYVLFTTAPSAVGLSTTVGLGQGNFRVYLDGENEMVVNELGNAGLFSGPVTYATLAAAIDAETGN